jgi:outer membrane lipoprotein-sorting protein
MKKKLSLLIAILILVLSVTTGCGQKNVEKNAINEKKVIRIGY